MVERHMLTLRVLQLARHFDAASFWLPIGAKTHGDARIKQVKAMVKNELQAGCNEMKTSGSGLL
jgi:hypothetical protein